MPLEVGREHGDGAVGEVDAGATEAGFEIERGAGADVVADVGDVDLEFEVAVGEGLDEDGVVEVAGGFAVDGDDGEVAEVSAGLRIPRFARLVGSRRLGRLGRDAGLLRCARLQPEERLAASARTLVGKVWGRWCLRMMISTSTPKASGGPRTSMTRPRAGRPGVGKSVTSTSTARPSRGLWLASRSGSPASLLDLGFFAEDAVWGGLGVAGISMPSGMRMGWVMRSSSGVT